MTDRQREIMLAWKQTDEDFPHKSMQFMIAIVCDRYGCGPGDVIDALLADNEEGDE